jgi:hypothetical protein
MPQLDLKYSASLNLDTQAIFKAVEAVLQNQDSSAGECKCRAYPAKEALHTHVLLQVAVLRKPHRDHAFMQSWQVSLTSLLAGYVPVECHYAVELSFASDYYSTRQKV